MPLVSNRNKNVIAQKSINKNSNKPIKLKNKIMTATKSVKLEQPIRDTISDTISFVIKGKLTPIKPPSFVAKKTGIGKKDAKPQAKPPKIQRDKIKTPKAKVKIKKKEPLPKTEKITTPKVKKAPVKTDKKKSPKTEVDADLAKRKTIEKLLKQANRVLKNPRLKLKPLKAAANPKKIVKKTVLKKETPSQKTTKMTPKTKKQTNPSEISKTIKKELIDSDELCLEDLKNRKEAPKTPKKPLKTKPPKKTVIVRKTSNPKSRTLKLFHAWNSPKKHRVASLNALAKVHCLYENEGHDQLSAVKKEKLEATEVKTEAKLKKTIKAEDEIPTRTLRSVPGLRGVGKHWEHGSSSDSEADIHDLIPVKVRKRVKIKKEIDKDKPLEAKKQPMVKKRKRQELIMDLKDMVVRKRMASLNASAILSASYSQERKTLKSPKSENDNGDSSNSSDEYFEASTDEDDKPSCYDFDVKKEDNNLIQVRAKPNKKVAVILNQDTDVTITGVYVNSTRSTHHEGFCSIAGMQYRISATSHTQTAATAVATETLLQSSASSTGTQENSNSESQSSCKSYTPLDALSNMQPPQGAGNQIPPHQNMGPPPHIMPPHQLSPGGRRHGCASAFSAPHPSGYHAPLAPPGHHVPPPPMAGEPGYIHGFYQPAGPLITVPHGHSQAPQLGNNLPKNVPLSETSPASVTSPLTNSHQGQHPPPSSNGGDSSDSEVIITSVIAGKDNPIPPPQGSYARYGPHPYQQGAPPGYSYTYPAYYHHTPYAHHDLCYSPAPPGYLHHKYQPPPPPQYRRYVTSAPQYYGPPNPDVYNPSPVPPSQQVVTSTPSVSGAQAYQHQQPPVGPPPPTIMETFPPTLVETYPAPYYQGYTPAPSSSCYSHAPPPRSMPYMNAAYQNCPCPMQSCPKNGVTGPLTGNGKRSGINDSMPLPPVALALPLEPASATGPPSPARGSAGMPPPPSPAGATYQTPPTKQESISPGTEEPTQTKRKARVGKANVRNTMLLMCNPVPNVVKREIESPKEKEIFLAKEPTELEIAAHENQPAKVNIQTLDLSDASNVKLEETTPPPPAEPQEQAEPLRKTEIKPIELEPIVSTVAENVKVKNMKRKLSQESQAKEAKPEVSPAKKTKVDSSYKNLIKKETSLVKINNGRRKLIIESKMCLAPKIRSRTNQASRKKIIRKRKLSTNTQTPNKKTKQLEKENQSNTMNQRKKATPNKNTKKLAPAILDNLIAINNVDRTIESVISESLKLIKPSETNAYVESIKPINKKCLNNNNIKSVSKKECKQVNSRRSQKCNKEIALSGPKLIPKSPRRSLVTPRWSNGWCWEGTSYEAKIFLNSDETTVIRRCYPAMRHESGDIIELRDCVLLKAGSRKNELPFVAKIAALWENPDDGEMMMSLLWYYRPEHTEQGRVDIDQPDEVFASKHKDSNSVACIDDKCYVLTYNEYCRYRKHLRRLEEGIEEELPSPCIPSPELYPRSKKQPPQPLQISPDMVFFCRRVYDFRQKRIIKNPT